MHFQRRDGLQRPFPYEPVFLHWEPVTFRERQNEMVAIEGFHS
jgi:hypothetical protein